MMTTCTYCGVFPAQTNNLGGDCCSWCAGIRTKTGKESTAAECYERARWDRFMARRLEHKVKVDGLLGYTAAVQGYFNSATAYQKLGDSKRTTDPRYVMFVEGRVVINTPSINFEKAWYGLQPKPWPEGWYHVDECFSELYGPFESDIEADQSLKRYCATLERPETD